MGPCRIIFDFVFNVGTENLNGGSPACTTSGLPHSGTLQAPSSVFTEEETQKLDFFLSRASHQGNLVHMNKETADQHFYFLS